MNDKKVKQKVQEKPDLNKNVKKNNFIEVKYTGYNDGKIFDSNIEEDLKKLDEKAKVKDTKIVIGQRMLVPGFDSALEDKEISREYRIKINAKEGFGERNRELVRTIPLRIFTEKQINPYPGLVLALDNNIAKVIAVSGARVVTDFNNPLAGKEIEYKFTITRKIEDEKEKAEVLFSWLFRFLPEFELKEKEILVKGSKEIEIFVSAFKDKFKELLGKDLVFQLKEEKKEVKLEEKRGRERSENKESLKNSK